MIYIVAPFSIHSKYENQFGDLNNSGHNTFLVHGNKKRRKSDCFEQRQNEDFLLSFIYLLKNVCTKRRLVVDELVGLVVPAVKLSDFLTDLL